MVVATVVMACLLFYTTLLLQQLLGACLFQTFLIHLWLLLGLRESDIMDCVAWMRPFAHVLDRQQQVELKKFPQITVDNSHNIQTHVVSLELLVCYCCCVTYYITDCFFCQLFRLHRSTS